MSNSQSVQEIFKSGQYFWCHEGNENIANWLATNNKDHPHLYATYINDANAVIKRKRTGKPVEHDKRMLKFLEEYPMTHNSVIEELTWYKSNILEQKDWSGVGPHTTGLVDVRTYGGDNQILAQARDLLYKQVFDHDTRHYHWVQRGEQDVLNPNEVEPLSKKQKAHQKSQKRWAKMDTERAAKEAAGPTGEVRHLMSGLEVAGQEQGHGEEDVEMDG